MKPETAKMVGYIFYGLGLAGLASAYTVSAVGPAASGGSALFGFLFLLSGSYYLSRS